MKLLHTFQGIEVLQDEDTDEQPKRIHYVADMDVDVDGSKYAYRLDNRQPPALDDIHASAGYPNDDWHNVLVPDSNGDVYVDSDGFCVSMTSYQREEFDKLDRQRYVDALAIPYSVIPGLIRKLCKGVLLGCAGRITRTDTGTSIDTVTADFSGSNIGECSQRAAQPFGSQWNAHNGDGRCIYLYEFFPDVPALINGEQFELKPA